MKLLVVVLALCCLSALAKRKGNPTIQKLDGLDSINGIAHKTTKYYEAKASTTAEEYPLINGMFFFLRRGATFQADFTLSEKGDGLTVSANFMLKGKSTPVAGFNVKKWEVRPQQDTKIAVYQATIEIPANAPVGLYELTFKVKESTATVTKNAFIMFNVWSQDDEVYLEKPEERQEYVLEENGLIWVGSANDYSAAGWRYGQFTPVVIESAIVGLTATPLKNALDYASAGKVARQLSFAGGDSICWGKWNGNYTHETNPRRCGYKCNPDGVFPGTTKKTVCTEPWKWRDVSQMLDQGHRISKTKRVQVQWCQCFVFAALMNALGRSIGLPTRAVTNFQSAADHNLNNKIDKYYTIKKENGGSFYEDVDSGFPGDDDPDSVWNFHVWNEAYINMPKAGPKNDIDISGWQAFDATPQVESPASGRYEMGPAPVKAVHRNQLSIGFDTLFVVSEVNANVTVNVKEGDKWVEKINSFVDPFDRSATPGQKLSTKRPGAISCDFRRDRGCESSRLDLTAAYKKPEPSGPNPPFKRNIGDIEAKLIFPSSKSRINRGDDIKYGYIFENLADRDIDVSVMYKVNAVDYTDRKLFKVSNTKQVITVPAGQNYKFQKTVQPEAYEDLFAEGEELMMGAGYLEFTLSARVDDGSIFFHKKVAQIHDDAQMDDMNDFFY